MDSASHKLVAETLSDKREKQTIATWSVIASSSLAAFKFAVGVFTGSLGLIAEAAHSLLDLVSTLITLLVIQVAAIPPDRDHPYGHEKAEHLGALTGMALLAITAFFILYHAFSKIFVHPIAPNVTIWSFAVLIISIGVDLCRARALRKAAKKHYSDALASDAEHFSNDMLGALAVLAGLTIVGISRVIPVPDWIVARADAFAAIIVACIALRSVWSLSTKAVRALMDNIPADLTDRLKTRVESVEGVVKGSAELRTRFVGNRPYVEIKLGTPRGGSLESAHRLSEVVESTVRAELADAQATVHVEPTAIPDESPAASIRATADRLGLRVHNLNIYRVAQNLRVELDLELPDSLSLLQAHRHSEALERAVTGELSERVQITVHLEPRNDQPCPAVRQSKITQSVRDVVSSLAQAADVRVHDVLITDEGLVVTLQKAFPGDRSLRETHEEMSELERTLKPLIPDLARVHIDPEISNPD
ncbi:MAG TPA: cation diffusion facilitator family transporter [Chthoniobacterales bacterium]|nr:cation diffusion facilitator family transporter [Chthoniobacterales bacterium]